ncbi:MAG: hypothetical protein H6686_03725 [Fibrobacteria bacterium]|nr:hypothetical protein [Fibrobacteria bacterium]
MKIFPIPSLVLLVAAMLPAAPVDLPVTDSSVRILGRTTSPTAGEVQWGWSGSGAMVAFRGTACWARLEARGTMYRVIVDGKPSRTLDLIESGDSLHVLASGLADEPHVVEIRSLTEPNYGIAKFRGFRVEGAPARLPPPSPRRIEFYGNSITCGYGILDSVAGHPFAVSTQDEGRTYAARAADSLGADRHVVCWSGRGVVWNYNRDVANPTLPQLAHQILPRDRNLRWDFGLWTPDVVVINLGTNDFSHEAPDSANFHRTYLAFVDTLHARYPEAKFVLLDGPMLSDGWPTGVNTLSIMKKHLDNVKAAAQAKGVEVSRLSLTPQDPQRGYGADYHPNLAQAELNGQELAAHLSRVMSWEGKPVALSPTSLPGEVRLVPDPRGWVMETPGLLAGDVRILDAQGRLLARVGIDPSGRTLLPTVARPAWVVGDWSGERFSRPLPARHP